MKKANKKQTNKKACCKVTLNDITNEFNMFKQTSSNGYNTKCYNACVKNCLENNMLPNDLTKKLGSDIVNHPYYKQLKENNLVCTKKIGLYIYVMYKSNIITDKQLLSLYNLIKLDNRYNMAFKKPCKVIDNEHVRKLNIRKYDMYYMVTPCYTSFENYNRVHTWQAISNLYQ